MKNKIPVIIIALHYILASLLSMWGSEKQEQNLQIVSVISGLLVMAIGLGLFTWRKTFIISALVVTWLTLLSMPFVALYFFEEIKFGSMGVCLFFTPLFLWEYSVLLKELKQKSNQRTHSIADSVGSE